MKEITVEQLHNLPRDSYELIDIRDDGLVEYRHRSSRFER